MLEAGVGKKELSPPQTVPIVGSRFVADRNSVGFARKTALTISFVERGFERLSFNR